MSHFGASSGVDATIAGGPFNGVNANVWAHYQFLPGAAPRIIGIAVAVIVGIWEFCAFFPAEIVIWQRVTKGGLPSRSSFAPWTTLILRYLMLCFSVSTAFVNWSTTMASDAACKAAGGFTFASWSALVFVCAFAIAWRAQAVARGPLQDNHTMMRLMQCFVAILVLCQLAITIFTAVWLGVRQQSFWMFAVYGQCHMKQPPSNGMTSYTQYGPRQEYYNDPLLWYWVFVIIFNLICLLIVLIALHTLATHSRGFSKFITGMRNHSVFYFSLVLLLSILGIVWRKVQNAEWIVSPTTVVQAAVMIRLLLAEQNAARRPMDTTYMGHHAPSRYLSTRGAYPTAGAEFEATRPNGTDSAGGIQGAGANGQRVAGGHDVTIQFADQVPRDTNGTVAMGATPPSAATMRPCYQPYSMMDNLGQAFSQIDSRNPHDLDGQSYDQSQGDDCSLDLPPNMYPGVFAMEERERRMLSRSHANGHGVPYAADRGLEEEDECEKQASQSSGEKDMSESSRRSEAPSNVVEGGRIIEGDDAARVRRRRASVSASFNHLSDEEDDEDDEIGIQTSQF